MNEALDVLDLGAAPLTGLHSLDGSAISAEIVRGQHRLHELGVSSDEWLERALDRHPREQLMVFTMGSDPRRPEEWTLVDARAASGAELMRAAATGRLWFNILYADRHHDELREVRERITSELAEVIPDLLPEHMKVTLLVSSRDAMVYYHADAGPNLLLHMRGRKQLRVYPALDPGFADPELMEDIFAGVRIENLPYQLEFEARASAYDLEPGQLIAWPQNAPHRVVNLDSFNVSLAIEFVTDRSRRRVLTWAANRFWSRRMHLRCRSTRERGLWSSAKRFGFRVARKLGIDRTIPRHVFLTDLQVDASSPTGTRAIGERIELSF